MKQIMVNKYSNEEIKINNANSEGIEFRSALDFRQSELPRRTIASGVRKIAANKSIKIYFKAASTAGEAYN